MGNNLLSVWGTVGSVLLACARVGDGASMDALRSAADAVASETPTAVVVLACERDGKVQLAAACGKDALAAGAHCGKLLKAVSPIVGGGGGGRSDSATSGGKNPAAIPAALSAALSVLQEQLGV